MEDGVNGNMEIQALGFFRRVPGSAKESVYVGPFHGKGVIEAKDGVKGRGFKFSLADHAASNSFCGFVPAIGKVFFHIRRVMGVLIRFNDGAWCDKFLQLAKKFRPGPSSFVRAFAIFFQGLFHKKAFCRHSCDLES